MTARLDVAHLTKHFPLRDGAFAGLRQRLAGTRAGARVLHAVEDVSLTIGRGETVGLVGESGCGKSTLVRLLARLLDPTSGEIRFDAKAIGDVPARRFARSSDRTRIQMVFQDATESLNPRLSAFDAIAEPLRRLTRLGSRDLTARVEQCADLTGLPGELLSRYPHQLSGGQKARVGIARAIAVEPNLLLLDEPTSALDVSVQATILHLLADLRTRLGMSYLFVSHDLNVVRLLCDRVLVMYLGRIVEAGPAETLFRQPRHPYTQALVSAVPSIDPAIQRLRIRLEGEPTSPIDPAPTICRFHGRCRHGTTRCTTEMPALRMLAPEHAVACHFAETIGAP